MNSPCHHVHLDLNCLKALLLQELVNIIIGTLEHLSWDEPQALHNGNSLSLSLSLYSWLVPHETAAISAHILCTPYNHAPVYSVILFQA